MVTFAPGAYHGRWYLAGSRAVVRTRSMRRAVFLLLGLTLFLLPALMLAPGADAHAELERSDPPSEGLLAVPPRRIDLWFTERIDVGEGSPSLQVMDDEGRALSVSDVLVDPQDPRHVTANVGGLAPGTTTVVWAVRSIDDGHTLTGTFAFRVGAGRAPGAATVEGERPPAWAVATRWLTFLGAAMAAAGFAFTLFIVRPREEAAKTRIKRTTLVIAGLAIALFATAAELFLQWQRPPAGAISPSLGDALAGLPNAWWIRPLALVPCLLVALLTRRWLTRQRPLPSALVWLGLLLALVSLLGLSLTSHAAARESWRLPALTSNIVHQWSIALWVGGLAHLWLWWSQRSTDGIGADDPDGLPDSPVRRFSRLALLLVVLGVGTGIANSGLVLPTLRSLWSSDYGIVLILKVALLTIPLAFATFNRRALRRSISALLPTVRRAVRVEAVLVLAVVLGGSSLALLAPPVVQADRPLIADVPMPALAAYNGQDLLVHLIFAPGKAGENTTRVKLTNYDRTPFTGASPALVRLTFSNIVLGTDPTALDLTRDADGSWSLQGTQLSLPGWWNINVTVRWLGQPDVVVPFFVLLPDPNLNGLDAPDDDPPSDPAAAQAFQAAMALYTSMHRVRYTQAMSSHIGSVAYGVHVVNDGSDGSEPGFTFDIPGGWQYVVLGTKSWSKRPGEPWEQGKANPMVPPERWDEEFVDARGFQFGRQEEINGELAQTITFVVPGTRKQVVAWYVWWIGTETGRVLQEMMISQTHYMLTRFSEFDEPAPIEPPQMTSEATVASPVP